MRISKIYEKYKIPPSLQMHMFRVAAVAWTICENIEQKTDVDNIIAAELLHDIGNIIKFNFEVYPELYQPEGVEYWKSVQVEFRTKYGNDEHRAVKLIIDEIGVTDRIKELVEVVGALKTMPILELHDVSKWVANYADYRVSPFGIVSLKERLEDGRKRYVLNKGPVNFSMEFALEIEKNAKILEKRISRNCKIDLNSINDKLVSDKINLLQDFEISTK